MIDPLYFLTSKDKQVLKQVIAQAKLHRVNAQLRTDDTDYNGGGISTPSAPEVYVALSPEYGIPPNTYSSFLDAWIPGSALCDIYLIGPDDQTNNQYLQAVGGKELVYNLSTTAIAGSPGEPSSNTQDYYIPIIRDNYGSWIAVSGTSTGSSPSSSLEVQNADNLSQIVNNTTLLQVGAGNSNITINVSSPIAGTALVNISSAQPIWHTYTLSGSALYPENVLTVAPDPTKFICYFLEDLVDNINVYAADTLVYDAPVMIYNGGIKTVALRFLVNGASYEFGYTTPRGPIVLGLNQWIVFFFQPGGGTGLYVGEATTIATNIAKDWTVTINDTTQSAIGVGTPVYVSDASWMYPGMIVLIQSQSSGGDTSATNIASYYQVENDIVYNVPGGGFDGAGDFVVLTNLGYTATGAYGESNVISPGATIPAGSLITWASFPGSSSSSITTEYTDASLVIEPTTILGIYPNVGLILTNPSAAFAQLSLSQQIQYINSLTTTQAQNINYTYSNLTYTQIQNLVYQYQNLTYTQIQNLVYLFQSLTYAQFQTLVYFFANITLTNTQINNLFYVFLNLTYAQLQNFVYWFVNVTLTNVQVTNLNYFFANLTYAQLMVLIGYATGSTSSLAGDVTGALGANSVVKLKGISLDTTAASPGDADILIYRSSTNKWVPNPLSEDVEMTDTGGCTVVAIQGTAVSSTAPTDTQVFIYNGAQWVPRSLSQDVTITDTGVATVKGLQSKPVSSIAPTTNQILQWNGTAWTPANVSNFSNPMTTLGDMIYENSSTATRLPVGANGSALVVNGGIPSWQAISGDVTLAANGSEKVVGIYGQAISAAPTDAQFLISNGSAIHPYAISGDLTITDTGAGTVKGLQGHNVSNASPSSGNILDYNGSAWVPVAVSGDITLATNGSVTVTDIQNRPISGATPAPSTGQVLTWNGSIWTPANASGGFTNPMTTAGDLIYESGTPAPTRLGIGTNGAVLSIVAGLPSWTNGIPGPAPSGAPTLTATGGANQVSVGITLATGSTNTYVYRSTSSSVSNTTGTLVYSSTGTSFTDTGLASSTTYYYIGYGVNNTDLGPASAVVNATTSSGYIVYDTFTDTNGTAITSHVPNVHPTGASYSIAYGGITIQGNEAETTSTSSGITVYGTYSGPTLINAGVSNCTVTLTIASYSGSPAIGLTFRAAGSGTTGAQSCFSLLLNLTTGYLYIYEVSGGTATALASTSITSYPGSFTMTLVLSGTSITATVGSMNISCTSSFNQTSTYYGFGASFTSDYFSLFSVQ